MTTYRSPPVHCLPKTRKRLSWWRRIVLGRKARIWYDAMTENDPMKLLARDVERTRWLLRQTHRMFDRTMKELRTAIRSAIDASDELRR
jgi:hypothetical protein